MELKVASILEKKTVATSKDEVEFEHAWKNGKWHCYQPLSFDPATVDSIQERPARWVGHRLASHLLPKNFILISSMGSLRNPRSNLPIGALWTSSLTHLFSRLSFQKRKLRRSPTTWLTAFIRTSEDSARPKSSRPFFPQPLCAVACVRTGLLGIDLCPSAY